MGKKDFQAVLGGLIVKPAGKPTLVPISDKRPAITNVNIDFKEIHGLCHPANVVHEGIKALRLKGHPHAPPHTNTTSTARCTAG